MVDLPGVGTLMTNSGKHLEEFVKQIESFLLPQGFTIDSRERVFNDEGIQIAEFDIVIEGKVGSAPFKMLIECRDRPSDGPAPGSWIEQLVGRRSRFDFDKVVAVSTTGFASGSKEFAKESRIELRSVEDLTADAIADWFQLKIYSRGGILNDVKFGVRDENAFEVLTRNTAGLNHLDAKTFMLIEPKTNKLISLASVWDEVFRAHLSMFDNMQDGEIKELTITTNYDETSERYQIQTIEGLIPVDTIIFRANFSIKKVSPARISQYSEPQRGSIAQSAQFVIDTGDGNVEVNWYKFKD